jgi:hypothetical protein
MRTGGISGNRMWPWLALAVVIVVVALIALPTGLSVLKTSSGNPAVADQTTTARTDAKTQNQTQAAAP